MFGGRSLVVGLNEPATGPELGAVNDLPPDEDGWLIGASAVVPFGTRGSVAATYQRVIRADQAALYSERVAADASWLLFGGSADVALAYDISALEVNDASLQFARPIGRGVAGSVELRRHRPFFDAWTIWGAFSPVAFDEARAELTWRNTAGNIGVDVRGAWRAYGETNAGLESTPLRTDGWRAGAGAEWLPRQAWMFYADYDVDIGFGASRSDIAAGARWMPDESRWLGLVGNGLQHIYEFRVGTGRVIGLRLEGGTRITPDVRLLADVALYDHHLTEGAAGPGLEPAAVFRAPRLDRGSRSRNSRSPGDSPVRRLFEAAIALTMLASVAAGQRGTAPFPHQRHERLFPLCESCHAGIATGDAATSMPTEASCRECHNGTDARAVTWQRTAHGQGLLRFSHVSHQREVDSTGRACATCHGTAGGTLMTVQRAQPPTCLGCHTHRATAHLADDNRCATCHVPLTAATGLNDDRIAALPKPPSHERPDFQAKHQPGTPLASASCATCHARESCSRCHVNAATQPVIAALGPDPRVARLMAGRAAVYPVPADHRSEGFNRTHGPVARGNTNRCAACHARPSCTSCHIGAGAADVLDEFRLLSRAVRRESSYGSSEPASGLQLHSSLRLRTPPGRVRSACITRMSGCRMAARQRVVHSRAPRVTRASSAPTATPPTRLVASTRPTSRKATRRIPMAAKRNAPPAITPRCSAAVVTVSRGSRRRAG